MDKRDAKIKLLLKDLKKQNINTWFDLGLFLDRIKEDRDEEKFKFSENYKDFKEFMCNANMAFLTFQFAIDGVSIEVKKYTKIFKDQYNSSNIYYIAGKFFPESKKMIPEYVKKFELESIQGFDDWKLYKDFFFTHLERGSKEYNELIIKFWKETLQIVEDMGNYIVDKNIQLLYLINVCSNPGNVSLALAVTLLSEYLKIPVINNSHDFYWEGGNKEINKKVYHLPDGPRDFFFKNAHVGEFFSIIEMLYPWDSRTWMHVNINKQQTERLIKINGINPANVTEIGTAVDTSEYQNTTKRKKISTFYQFEKILSRYQDTLISYSTKDVLEHNLVSPKSIRPILIGARRTKPLPKFLNENIIFLQPTRIIARKRIEIGFNLVKKLFDEDEFYNRFKETDNLKLTLLITGPIAVGHFDYFRQLLKRFEQLLSSLEPKIRNKLFLAFLFSELDKKTFKEKFDEPVGIPELYNIASLVLLPSKTEGRGLPIIEATACGTPIFCSRYYPENVYSEVIGEHLPHQDRLKVIEFDGKNITKKHTKKIMESVFFPHKFTHVIAHNQQVVDKRYSLKSLKLNFDDICQKIYYQLNTKNTAFNKAKKAIKDYQKIVNFTNPDLEYILNTKNREYLPGFGRLRFMILLKSLIDPSYFRVEEQFFRGKAYQYARQLLKKNPKEQKIKKVHQFFNAIESIFLYNNGEVNIRHDHSLPYRHRNKNYYPYQDFTIQELSGLINMLYHNIINAEEKPEIDVNAHFFTDLDLALSQLTFSTYLGIDDRKFLIKKLQSNVPIAYFPGKYIKNEIEFFALQAVRSRLELKIDEELTDDILKGCWEYISPIYILASTKTTIENYNRYSIEKFILEGNDEELKLLYKYKILKVINIDQWCVGIHFNQIGEEGLKVLRKIKEEKGFIISNRTEAAVMTDIVDIDRFHIGKIEDRITESIMGIPMNTGFIQYVPASMRVTLAYPTPVQTAKDFHDYLKSEEFKKAIERFGEDKVFEILRNDAQTKMSPVKKVIGDLLAANELTDVVSYEFVSGVYKDKMPWNGVIAKTQLDKAKWEFIIQSSEKTQPVTSFVKKFEEENTKKVKIAWNGGYILNPELVGKLGLPESYIGSPLGLLISEGKVLSAPLFNKPALVFTKKGVDICRVNCSKGICVSRGTVSVEFSQSQYNNESDKKNPAFFDLMYGKEEISAHGKIFVRLAGNVIKDIIKTKENQTVKIIPVGLTLAFPKDKFPTEWKVGDEVELKINGLENINHAVEAGPMLIENGKLCLDMKIEGWKTQNSIKTQAARLDYTDMRGPKIAAGIDKKGNLVVLAINGRIRESVGATHLNMAEILQKFNIIKGMGFDPGGSSTLVVNGETLNISPYNSRYEENVFSLPPQPRAVSNVVMGYIKDTEK
ncbi:MAG: phosphodiester glycosidase family protein [Bacteroidota bacterium]|nr:phosphodiester glycosidase family protein [Bacteroidota bacterium]